jgi:hypothetical protein
MIRPRKPKKLGVVEITPFVRSTDGPPLLRLQNELPPGYDRCQKCGRQNVGVLVDPVQTNGLGMILPVGLEGMRLRMRNPETGRTSPYLKQDVKKEYSPSRQQEEYVVRIFNRLDDSYAERYYDPNTGEVPYFKAGRRKDQSIHGQRGKKPQH